MKHKHHIIPKHMGGTDDPNNLIELTIEEHAEAHKKLYEDYGKIEDYWAWKGLSGQIDKEEIIREMNSFNGKKSYEEKLGIFSMTEEERLPYIKKGGRNSGRQNAISGHCAKIAHLGGKASSGMKFWYNPKTNEETRAFECPGKDWISGVKMDRVNIEQLRKQANNTKGTFWIQNPETGESKMIFPNEQIPEGFIVGRKVERKNTIELLNVGEKSSIKLKKIKSIFNDIHFDDSYERWILTIKIGNKKNKITHIDYFTLVWARDSIINYYNLNLVKSEQNFTDSYSKEEVVEILKSFREYKKIEKILEGKLKKSKRDIYKNKLIEFSINHNLLINKRNKFL